MYLMSIGYRSTLYNGFGVESVPKAVSTTVGVNVHTVIEFFTLA
jgi:hypothetical protein